MGSGRALPKIKYENAPLIFERRFAAPAIVEAFAVYSLTFEFGLKLPSQRLTICLIEVDPDSARMLAWPRPCSTAAGAGGQDTN